MSYNYSVAHKTISGGFDFIHKQHFGLMLSLGLSQYDYSAKATMNGDVDAYKFVHSDVPVIVTYSNGMSERASPQFNYKISQGKVTNKAFDFDFTDYGCYVAIEPHYQFNKHYGASLRPATSVGKDTSIGTNVNSELSLRLNYKPINPLEIYVGYQYFSLGKDLDEDSSTPSSSGHGESNLTIDTRGFLTGVALRF